MTSTGRRWLILIVDKAHFLTQLNCWVELSPVCMWPDLKITCTCTCIWQPLLLKSVAVPGTHRCTCVFFFEECTWLFRNFISRWLQSLCNMFKSTWLVPIFDGILGPSWPLWNPGYSSLVISQYTYQNEPRQDRCSCTRQKSKNDLCKVRKISGNFENIDREFANFAVPLNET